MKILLQWFRANRVILVNAGSLVGTIGITSLLGFAYWWVAAHQFSKGAVGLASAANSAMTLLGTACVLGLGTLLIGELPQQRGKELPLISAALLLVGAIGGLAGIIFAFLAPFIARDLAPLGMNIGNILLFAAGVSLTAVTIVFDQALIGLLRGELQFWRNAFFSLAKLVILYLVSLWLKDKIGLTIYTTWTISNALSLIVMAGYATIKKGWLGRAYLPEWRLLRKLGPQAIQHHAINLILRVPPLVLPVIVTILLSAELNASFYIAFMIANIITAVPTSLTTVLYATSTAEPETLTRKARMTFSVSVGTTVLASVVLLLGAGLILGIFGHSYAQDGIWSLRILTLASFPLIVKNYFIAVCRIYSRMKSAILPMTLGILLELVAAAVGGHLGSLSGLSLGWLIALCIESVFMFPTVYRDLLSTRTALQKAAKLEYASMDMEYEPDRQLQPALGERENVESRVGASYEKRMSYEGNGMQAINDKSYSDATKRMIRCPFCDEFIPATAKYCSYCGEEMAAQTSVRLEAIRLVTNS